MSPPSQECQTLEGRSFCSPGTLLVPLHKKPNTFDLLQLMGVYGAGLVTGLGVGGEVGEGHSLRQVFEHHSNKSLLHKRNNV